MGRKIYQTIACRLAALRNCQESGNVEWEGRHEEALEFIEYNFLPSGSGFDCGTKINVKESTPDRLVLETSFHHMNEHGYYDGWTEHKIIVTPSLSSGFDLRVTGRNRNQIKEYIADMFGSALDCETDKIN